MQPYIKLHGSCNSVEGSAGSRILVMGGQKAVNIGRFPLLTWYHQEFRNFLNRPGAKLMVIGYSFSDEHINDAIINAAQAGLKIFLVDPSGEKILDKPQGFDTWSEERADGSHTAKDNRNIPKASQLDVRQGYCRTWQPHRFFQLADMSKLETKADPGTTAGHRSSNSSSRWIAVRLPMSLSSEHGRSTG